MSFPCNSLPANELRENPALRQPESLYILYIEKFHPEVGSGIEKMADIPPVGASRCPTPISFGAKGQRIQYLFRFL